MTKRKYENIEVILKESDANKAPFCPHGPTLLFERYKANGEVERFFSCSSSRDRKNCNFYQRHGEVVSKEVMTARTNRNKNMQPPMSHGQYVKRLKDFKALPTEERKICLDCGLLLLAGEEKKHAAHKVLQSPNDSVLSTPTQILQPLENNKTNAQYFFSDKCTQFLVEMFQQLGYKKIVCIGVPRIHETIQVKNKMSSFLLDIDHRFEQFYDQDCFQRYNMFNNHFFSGERAVHTFRKFLLQDTGPVAVITDPPFGGLVSIIAHTLDKITEMWRETNSIDKEDGDSLPVFLTFPYFMEPRIQDTIPNITMLDYKIAYENHASFQNEKRGKRVCKKGSPVRIFTNVSAEKIVLPGEEGYRFCEICLKYVAEENKHCDQCKACTSKDGSQYVHCDKCNRCVKPSRVHCDKCNHCHLPHENCSMPEAQGCHICGDMSHKRRECPQKGKPHPKKGQTKDTIAAPPKKKHKFSKFTKK